MRACVHPSIHPSIHPYIHTYIHTYIHACIHAYVNIGAGYLFGNVPAVQHNFTLVVLGIVLVSVLPVVYEIWQARKEP